MRDDVDPVESLDKCINRFSDGVGADNFQRNLARSEFKKSHSKLSNSISNSEDGATVRSLSTRMYSTDLFTGGDNLDPASSDLREFVFADNEARNEQLVEWLEMGYESQLRWSLVTVFELHERFLKDLYAAIGYLDPNLWRGVDFGKESIANVETKSLEWYSTQVRKVAKNNCEDIVKQLRKIFPEFNNHEETKWWGESHKSWRSVIEYFRHMIVHSHGYADEDKFWIRINEQTGKSVTGTSEGVLNLRASVLKFTTKDGAGLSLQLANCRSLSYINHHQIDEKHRQLIRILINHSCLAYCCAIKHFDLKPFWQRNSLDAQPKNEPSQD